MAEGFDPAPMEKEGVAGEPKGGALKLGAGVPGLPKGMGAGVEVWPNTGVGVPNAGLSAVAVPNANPPI